jgi:predicted RNA-binding Zn ribbon-like protein
MASDKVTTIIDFLNTLNLTRRHDAFASQASLVEWLSRGRSLEESPSLDTVALAAEVREAIRTLLISHSGGDPSPSLGSLEVLNRAAGMVQVALGFEGGGVSSIRPTGVGLEGEIASVLAAVHSAMADGTWQRIRVCRNPACRWAFYDRSRNQARMWCSMAECGNRMKARRFRRRREAHRSEQ